MSQDVSRNEKEHGAKPLALNYVERVPLGERPGRYDDAREVLVVEDGESVAPLVRANETVLDDTVTKVRADPGDPADPRRGAAAFVRDGDSRFLPRRPALDETQTRVRAETSDQGSRRRVDWAQSAGDSSAPVWRAAVLDGTKTAVRADRDDPPSPRRS